MLVNNAESQRTDLCILDAQRISDGKSRARSFASYIVCTCLLSQSALRCATWDTWCVADVEGARRWMSHTRMLLCLQYAHMLAAHRNPSSDVPSQPYVQLVGSGSPE